MVQIILIISKVCSRTRFTNFISHMVQIILLLLISTLSGSSGNFISHMVQIIPINAKPLINKQKALYPTWFR